jgi:hypothetical protein
LVIHYADLAPGDVERVGGVPVTTPARSIRDAHASHLGAEIVGLDLDFALPRPLFIARRP